MLTIAEHRLQLIDSCRAYKPSKTDQDYHRQAMELWECNTDQSDTAICNDGGGVCNTGGNIDNTHLETSKLSDHLENITTDMGESYCTCSEIQHEQNKNKIDNISTQGSHIITNKSCQSDIKEKSDPVIPETTLEKLKISDKEISHPKHNNRLRNKMESEEIDELQEVKKVKMNTRLNHVQFDLIRISNILRDMVQNKEFVSLDLKSSGVELLPEELIEQINNVIQK